MNGRTRLASMSRQLRLRRALPALAVCLALAGCGGGGTPTSSSTSTSATTSPTQSAGLSAFQTCLKQHGVKITPRASFSPRAFPSGTAFPTGFPTAFPTGTRTGFPGRGTGANSAAFSICRVLLAQGFARPSPTPTPG